MKLSKKLIKENFSTLPNIITVMRIFLAITILIIFLLKKDVNYLIFVLFAISAVSDKLDGYIAKKYNMTSNWGAILDPIADKVLVFLLLIIMFSLGLFPFWGFAILIFKDLSILLYRYLSFKKGIIKSAFKLGRYKTFYNLSVFGIVLLLLCIKPEYTKEYSDLLKIALLSTII